ncbi:hypothetical protein KKC59_04535, partial [bacterium]|nr:hypothetical protein [bacterium]
MKLFSVLMVQVFLISNLMLTNAFALHKNLAVSSVFGEGGENSLEGGLDGYVSDVSIYSDDLSLHSGDEFSLGEEGLDSASQLGTASTPVSKRQTLSGLPYFSPEKRRSLFDSEQGTLYEEIKQNTLTSDFFEKYTGQSM